MKYFISTADNINVTVLLEDTNKYVTQHEKCNQCLCAYKFDRACTAYTEGDIIELL